MILSTLIPALEYDPSRTFTYVEQAFFTRWWNEQNPKMQDRVKKLVKSGQLAFVNGGWCMHDEAATHFMGMIDQTTLGHNFLKETFDYVPTVGWQIDPFGHSATQASLLSAEAGFDALYFGRIDYQDLQLRRDSKRVEGIWRASPDNLQKDAEVFWGLSGSYGGNYGPPSGFCFDNFCSDEPMMDDENLEDYNVDGKVADFVAAAYDQANQARGTHIMMTMGSDFQYENSEVWFRNLDSVIKHVNEYAQAGKIAADPNENFGSVKVFYSNPIKYTQAKNEDDLVWEVKTDDFFPYSDCEQCFWTGYFTSRAELKKFERTGSAFLQAARQIEAFSDAPVAKSTFDSPSHKLDAAVGVVQHHDGVSGTSKQHVAFDYAKRIDIGMKEAAKYVSDMLSKFLSPEGVDFDFTYCQGLNVSVCDFTQDSTVSGGGEGKFAVAAYNSLSHARTEIVSVPVSSNSLNFEVKSVPSGEIMSFDVIESTSAVDESAAPYTLYFEAEDVPAMAARVFIVTTKEQDKEELVEEVSSVSSRALRGSSAKDTTTTIKNNIFSVDFDKKGRLQSIAGKKITQDWGYYTSFDSSRVELGATPQPQGDYLAWTPGVPGTCLPGYLDMEGDEERWLQESDGQNSGAYIFRPSRKNENLNILEAGVGEATNFKVTEGDLVTEVYAEFGDWIKQTTRVMKDKNFVEVEWTVGPVPIDDGVGKEVVTRFNTDIKNGKDFFTDSNGREFLKRTVDHRPTWDLEVFQPIAGNYYPVNAAIFIEDDDTFLTVLNDRTQGGASLSEGSIEMMVQRRIVADDSRGVGEPLDETTGGVTPYPPYGEAERVGEGVIIKGVHRIVVGEGSNGASAARKEMDRIFSPLHMFFSDIKTKDIKNIMDGDMEIGVVHKVWNEQLPPQVSMITLSKVYNEPGHYFIRLAHQFGEGEDDNMSVPVKIDMKSILPHENMKLIKWTETSLTGNMERKKMEENKLVWKGEGDDQLTKRTRGRDLDDGDYVVIKPMEIRAFKIVVGERSEPF